MTGLCQIILVTYVCVNYIASMCAMELHIIAVVHMEYFTTKPISSFDHLEQCFSNPVPNQILIGYQLGIGKALLSCTKVYQVL